MTVQARSPADDGFGLGGRLAVVTGGTMGIGAAVVQRLAERGARVAFCARSPEAVEQLAARLVADGSQVRGYVADLGRADETTAFLASVTRDMGEAEILVNNVGRSPSRNFLHLDDDGWRDLFELNLFAAVRCSRALLPAMRRRHWGRIVMVSSGVARYPSAALIDYSASKAAMVATGKALATRYGPDGVLVNSVLPGLVATPMWDRAAAEIAAARGTDAASVLASVAADVPVGRYAEAREVADVIVFLCSEQASYVNGVALAVDGGLGSGAF